MIGISSPTFSFAPFDQVLERIAKEFELWEIVAEFEHILDKNEERISYASDSYDIKFQAHAPIADMNIGSPVENIREASLKELFSLIDACDRLSIDLLTLHPGMAIAYGEELKPKVRDATRQSLKQIDRKLQDLNVRVALENMPPADWSIGYDLKELLLMIEGTKIGICFDTGHANVAHTVDTFVRDDYPLINIHIHNNSGLFDEHLILDKGSLDLKSVVSRLKKFYEGNYVIEARTLEEGMESRDILRNMLDDSA
ncbi:MAG: sugar phosphate isomerase/epimerase [Thermoplasmata archaeon]|nr:sugar phosphate isomerase/epimerase [Thermoplasmata archaeon]